MQNLIVIFHKKIFSFFDIFEPFFGKRLLLKSLMNYI